jgi:hypothetical protein
VRSCCDSEHLSVAITVVDVMQWLAFALVVVGFLGVYSAWIAGRLDRIHRRLDAARVGLDQQLRERAEAVREVPALTAAADAALATADHCASLSLERQPSAMVLGPEREQAESALSRALRTVAPTDELNDVVTRVSFARQFHNDAVRDALELRSRWIVRLFHLAGSAARPSYFEIDDATVNRSAEISDVAGSTPP